MSKIERDNLKEEIFKNKVKIKSYGNQTISDNSLLAIDNGIILYPLEGNLIIFDCNICKEIKRIFITYSLIKVIKKIPLINYYLLCSENGHIFILDINYNILYNYKPKEINNVYSLDISTQIKSSADKFFQYISISHYSISKEDDDYFLVHTKNALSLIEMEIYSVNNQINNIQFKKIFTKPSLNDFSIFNYTKKQNINNIELISFHVDETNQKSTITVYNINNDNINNNNFNEKVLVINEITTEVKRYKKIYYSESDTLKIMILCKKRNMFLFNMNTLSIDDSFQLEGVGELGEFYIDNDDLTMLMVNNSTQLLKINIAEKISPRKIPLNENVQNLSEIIIKDNFIPSMNWGLTKVKCTDGNNKIIIVNVNGIKIYINKSNNWIEEYYSTSILKMSGCGVCSLPDNIYVYGDLSGNITIFDKNKEKYEQIPLDKEMVRSICSDKNNKIIYIGNISGKIFYYNYNDKTLLELKTNISNNNETITCLRYLHPNLYFSDTGGNVFIFNTKENKIIYNYMPHAPQKDNTNIEFGSLSIKSEVWSFFVHEIDDENEYIITGSEDQNIKIWRIKMNKEKNFIKKNKLIKIIKEHKYAVTCLDWSSIKYDDNSYKEVLLSCSDDKTINIFDCSEEKFNLLLKVDFSKCIWGFFTLTYCSFNHCNEISNENNNLLCVGAQAGYIIIYDIKDKKIKFLEKIHYGGIEGLVFENNIISTCGNDNTFNIIEINDA